MNEENTLDDDINFLDVKIRELQQIKEMLVVKKNLENASNNKAKKLAILLAEQVFTKTDEIFAYTWAHEFVDGEHDWLGSAHDFVLNRAKQMIEDIETNGPITDSEELYFFLKEFLQCNIS